MFSLEATGLDQLISKFSGSVSKVKRGMERGVVLAGELVMGRSKPNVPVLTGVLRASGRVEQAKWSGDSVSVDLTYNTPYAFRVHQDLLMRHPRGGTAKYLERPAQESRSDVQAIIFQSVMTSLD